MNGARWVVPIHKTVETNTGTARLSYGFLLRTVQGPRGVQHRLLGVVEELRDVL